MKKGLLVTALVPLLGALMVSCAATHKDRYEVLSSKTVMDVPLRMVRRTPLTAEGQLDNSRQPDYGVLDPSETFHRCGGEQCTDGEIELAAQDYVAKSSTALEPEVVRDGGGGGGM